MGNFGTGDSTGSQGSSSTDYKTLYASQLAQLQGMGFTNQSVNIDALKASNGNVDVAVQRLPNMLG